MDQNSYVPPTIAVRLTATVSGRPLIVCADLTGDEDRVADGLSNGTNGLDRIEITIDGTSHWVERRDLCDDDGDPIAWTPYDLPDPESGVGADLQAAHAMADNTTKTWTDERIWNVAIGPFEDQRSVLETADQSSMTPQDFARCCVEEAIEQGADFDRDEAFKSICRVLGVSAG